VPGPGSYNLKGIIGTEGPRRTLAGRFKIDLNAKELNQKPGPGQYTPQLNPAQNKSPNYRIGSSIREQYYLKDKFKYELPPPNIYNPSYEKTRHKAASTGFGYGDRPGMSRTFIAPGPGQYKSPSCIGEGPTYILGAKIEDTFEHKKAKDLPSPNHYNPKFDFLSKT